MGFTAGTGGLSATQNILSWTFTSAPTAPLGLTASVVGSSVNLAWTAPAGTVTSYDVYRGTASGAESLYQSGLTTTTFTDSSTTPGTTYYYKVTAVTAGGESAPSNEVSAAVVSVKVVTVDDSVRGTGLDQFKYSGSWSPVVNTSIPNCYDGTLTFTDATNDTATMVFTGTQIKLYAGMRNDRGIISVSIDGGSAVLVDEYAAQDAGDVLVYTSGVLVPGTHTLTIRNTGTHNANGVGTRVDIDKVDIIGG